MSFGARFPNLSQNLSSLDLMSQNGLPELLQLCLYRNSVYSSYVKILRSQGPLRLQPFNHCRRGKMKPEVLLQYYNSPFHDMDPQKYEAQKSI